MTVVVYNIQRYNLVVLWMYFLSLVSLVILVSLVSLVIVVSLLSLVSLGLGVYSIIALFQLLF